MKKLYIICLVTFFCQSIYSQTREDCTSKYKPEDYYIASNWYSFIPEKKDSIQLKGIEYKSEFWGVLYKQEINNDKLFVVLKEWDPKNSFFFKTENKAMLEYYIEQCIDKK